MIAPPPPPGESCVRCGTAGVPLAPCSVHGVRQWSCTSEKGCRRRRARTGHAPLAGQPCQTYWGSHGCRRARGHSGKHRCDTGCHAVDQDGYDSAGFRWSLYGYDVDCFWCGVHPFEPHEPCCGLDADRAGETHHVGVPVPGDQDMPDSPHMIRIDSAALTIPPARPTS